MSQTSSNHNDQMPVPAHRALSLTEQQAFNKLVDYAISKDRFFQYLVGSGSGSGSGSDSDSGSGHNMRKWALLIAIAHIICIGMYSSSTSSSSSLSYFRMVSYWCLGALGLQIVFITTHLAAHAHFLEYENFHVGNSRLGNAPLIKLAAFVHHHTNVAGMGTWCPFFSDTKPPTPKSASGWENIVAAHWSGYSVATKLPGLLLLYLVLMFISTPMSYGLLSFLLGYEAAVLALPYAHLWEHMPASRFHFVIAGVLRFLEFTGIIWARRDHDSHHVHTSFEVYQDFGSSGLSMWILKFLDPIITQWYRDQFHKAVSASRYVFDVIEPVEYWICRFIMVIVPLLVWSQCNQFAIFIGMFLGPALIIKTKSL